MQDVKRGPGRPRRYEGRERTSLMISKTLLKTVDEQRGTESRSVFIERLLSEQIEREKVRQSPFMKSLQ